MQKISEAFKQQKSGSARTDGLTKKAGQYAVPSSHGVAATAAPLPPAASAAPAAAALPQAPSSDQEDEAALRQFDLNTKFGPCSGMSRLERWERAVQLGLDPPTHIKELVLRHGDSTMFNRCLWEHPY